MWICVFICFLLLCSLSSLQPALDSSETCKYMLMVIWKSSAKNCGLLFYLVKGVQRTECLTLFGGTAYITGI